MRCIEKLCSTLAVVIVMCNTLASSPAPATSTRPTGVGTVLDPVPRASATKALAVAAHLHNLNRHKPKINICSEKHNQEKFVLFLKI